MYLTKHILNSYLKDIESYGGSALSLRRCLSLGRRAKNGNRQAQEQLILSSLKAAIWYAKKFDWSRLPLEDRVQLCNQGLCEAALRYDPQKGCKFTTYAVWWMRSCMARQAYTKGNVIHIPAHTQAATAKAGKFIEEYLLENGKYPTDKEICQYCEWDEKQWITYQHAVHASHAESLNLLPVGDARHFLLEPADKSSSFTLLVQRAENIQTVREALSKLEERRRRILTQRASGTTLLDIAKKEGISRERVRQIEARSLVLLANLLGSFTPKMSLGEALRDTDTSFYTQDTTQNESRGIAQRIEQRGSNASVASSNLAPSLA